VAAGSLVMAHLPLCQVTTAAKTLQVTNGVPQDNSTVRRISSLFHIKLTNPTPGRSPCPGLNALANHGWLPRSGKNISYEDIQYAATNGYNFASDVYLPAFLLANETFKLSTTGSSLTINLRDLARHNAIEVDGSQSRNDIYFGDNVHYDANVFAAVAKNLGLDDYSTGQLHVTVETAAKARAARQVDAKAVNPTFDTSGLQIPGSIGTTALYLLTLWDSDAKAAPKAWVKAFFGACCIRKWYCCVTELTIE